LSLARGKLATWPRSTLCPRLLLLSSSSMFFIISKFLCCYLFIRLFCESGFDGMPPSLPSGNWTRVPAIVMVLSVEHLHLIWTNCLKNSRHECRIVCSCFKPLICYSFILVLCFVQHVFLCGCPSVQCLLLCPFRELLSTDNSYQKWRSKRIHCIWSH
jgi:hypothetical protein